ncbi:hypothetical protein [Planococcus sp. CPCC 101016]|uniref:hypothetical protein n=1 Tax=Planococcus sp. CPCC 101016 TaxID=2599617 RepID=UPI0016442735|nr:hypothetical protein [Planococcus sp. CPCC 101016]
MPQAKWLKLGTAAFLSIGILAACGNSEPEAPNGEDEKNTEEQEDDSSDEQEEEEEED